MMGYDLHFYADKNGIDTLVAHGGRLNDDSEAMRDDKNGRPSLVTIPGSAPVIGEYVAALDGESPEVVLESVEEMIGSIELEQRFVLVDLEALRSAARSARRFPDARFAVLQD